MKNSPGKVLKFCFPISVRTLHWEQQSVPALGGNMLVTLTNSGSYMSAHALLNLLSELRKSGKM